MLIREINENDFDGLMHLYTMLHGNFVPEKTEDVISKWEMILRDKNHHIIVADDNGKIVSSVVCVIIPNLTHNQRPYAFVENVITDENYRGQHLASKCLDYAYEIAVKENCYKMMLLTGSKEEKTLNFYRNNGYNSEDKTAFIRWINP